MRMASRAGYRAQALVEFAVVSPFLLLILFGFLDFGLYQVTSLSLAAANRAGDRYAAVAPLAYSNSTPASSGTIEGTVQENALLATIPTSAIAIAYFLPAAGTSLVPCGSYSFSTDSFVPNTGYTQSTCLVQGVTVVEVTSSCRYMPMTPLLWNLAPHGILLTSTYFLMTEQT